MENNPDCFFCRKNYGNSVNIFNLYQLLHYLKISPKQDQTSVLICSDCNKFGCQLNNVFIKLEVTQMKINHLVEQLVSKIDSDSSRDASVLQTLMKEKCLSQLGSLKYPQVTLQKLTAAQISIPLQEDQVLSPISSPSSPLSPEVEEHIVKIEVDDEQSSTISKLQTRKRLPEISKSCRFCPKILNNSRVCRYHEAIFHPDKLLLEGKLDTTSDSQFLEICQDLLTSHKVVKNQHGCLYCDNKYTNIKCLKRHTIENHLPNTIEKVRQLQQTTGNDKKNGLACQYCQKVFKTGTELKNHKITSCETLGQVIVIKSEKVSGPEYPKFKVHVKTLPGQKIPCQFCSKTFQQSQSLRIHSTVQHYLHYLCEAKLDNVSDEHFELYCQDLFEGHYSRQKGGTKRECIYCEKSFTHFQNYKSHLIDEHIDILYDKLKEAQKESPKIKFFNDDKGIKVCKRVCQHCGKWILKQHLSIHMKYNCKERKDRGFCKQCKCLKRFYSVIDLKNHVCSDDKKKSYNSKRVQCDKCGTQLNFYRLKLHQLKYCGRANKRPTVYKKRKSSAITQISPLPKISNKPLSACSKSALKKEEKIN